MAPVRSPTPATSPAPPGPPAPAVPGRPSPVPPPRGPPNTTSPRPARLVAGSKDPSRALGVERALIGDDLDIEVMRQLERAQQGPGRPQVIVGSAGEERLHGHTTSHRGDGTTLTPARRE